MTPTLPRIGDQARRRHGEGHIVLTGTHRPALIVCGGKYQHFSRDGGVELNKRPPEGLE